LSAPAGSSGIAKLRGSCARAFRRLKVRWILEAVGATLILLFPVLEPLLTPGYRFVYHHHLPLTHLMDGILLDVCGLSAAGVVGLVFLPRVPGKLRGMAGGLFVGLLIWAVAYDAITLAVNWSWRNLSEAPQPSLLSATEVWWHRWSFRVVVALPLLIAALALIRPKIGGLIVRATRFGLALAAFCALWVIPELVYLDLRAHETMPVAAATGEAEPVKGERIVWVLLDELSYQLTVGQRPPGQDFPNLRKLHEESISFGNLEPAGNFTDLIIPSVLARHRIRQFRSTPEGRLLYLDYGQKEWAAYDAGRSLFAVAHDSGWNPGVVGWDIPYCRIFQGSLARCFWEPGVGNELPFEPWAADRDSAFSYALAVPRAFIAQVRSRRRASERRLEGMIADDRGLIRQAQGMLEDERVHFVFLHLPVPHPPGVYDRRTHQMCACGNYLDNLTMADDTLGVLMREIGQTTLAARTTVIVSSDHSWRVSLWKASPYWTAEEGRVSQGRFDPRPVFMIHFAGQKSGSEVMAPLPELVEYDVIAGMLEGKIRGPQDIEALVQSPSEVASLARR
jgi:hypothetical protein